MGGACTPCDGWVGGAALTSAESRFQEELKVIDKATETGLTNMKEVSEAQEGLVVFFFGKIYILFISSYKEIL